MADVYVVQHAFQGESGFAKDEFVNTFHAEVRAGEVGAMGDLMLAVQHFYWNIHAPAVVTLGSYLSHTINSFPATIKVYRLMNPPHTPPVASMSYNPADVGADPVSNETVPFEVACCMSYNATPTGGIAPGRLRGRIYLGPFNGGALGVDGRPPAGLLSTIRASGQALATGIFNAGFRWGVFSPTLTAEGGADPVIHPIARVSTDNAWDTQRRRGNAPTARTYLSLIL